MLVFIMSGILMLGYEYYLTFLAHFFASVMLFFIVNDQLKGRVARHLLILFYFLSYISPLVIEMLGISTKSSVLNWSNNHFLMHDEQVALIVFVASSFYFLVLILYFMALDVESIVRGTKCISNGVSSKRYAINFPVRYSMVKAISQKNAALFFWSSMVAIYIVLYIQNKYGYGVHGLPPYGINEYKIAGITIYLRDYIIPLIVAFCLHQIYRLHIVGVLLLVLLIPLATLSSLSKVTLIAYSGLLVYAIIRLVNGGMFGGKVGLVSRYIIYLSVLMYVVTHYVLITDARTIIIGQGEPIRDQLIMAVMVMSLSIENLVFYLSSVESVIFVSLFDRFLGFKELASVMFYAGEMDYYTNFLHYIVAIDQSAYSSYTSVRDFTGSVIGGGVGVDIVSAVWASGWFALFPVLFIFMNFLMQRLFIGIVSSSYTKLFEVVFMIMTLRIFVDGNFHLLKYFTYLLIAGVVLLMIKDYLLKIRFFHDSV